MWLGIINNSTWEFTFIQLQIQLIIEHLMFSDSSFDVTIVTKEQRITCGFLKHWSYFSLANSCRHWQFIKSDSNFSFVTASQNVFFLLLSLLFKGCQYQCCSNFHFFLFFSPIAYFKTRTKLEQSCLSKFVFQEIPWLLKVHVCQQLWQRLIYMCMCVYACVGGCTEI